MPMARPAGVHVPARWKVLYLGGRLAPCATISCNRMHTTTSVWKSGRRPRGLSCAAKTRMNPREDRGTYERSTRPASPPGGSPAAVKAIRSVRKML